MLGVGVDGVTEQRELHQRNGDDHPERAAVAPQLQELLEKNREETLQ